MKQEVVISILAGAAAGFVGALVPSLLSPGPARGERAQQVAPAEPGDQAYDDRSLRGDIEDLRMLGEDLNLRLRSLEEQGMFADAGRAAVAPKEMDPASFGDDLAALATALREGRTTENFQVLVASALDEIREQEDQERQAREHEQMLERTELRLTDLTEELGLTPYQVKELRPLLVAQEEKRMELFTAMREGTGDFSNVREQMRTIRDEHIQAVSVVLAPEQLEKYEDQGFRGGPGFGRGDFGGRSREGDGGRDDGGGGRGEGGGDRGD